MSAFSRLKLPLLTAALVLLMVVIRVFYGAVSELEAGEQALTAGTADEAIIHLERSLHWYLPLCPLPEKAANALWSIGSEAEARGDRETALEAYQALRSALYATRSFYTPLPGWIKKANERIASLQIEEPGGMWPDPTLPAAERKAIALAVLEKDDAPDVGWSAVSVLGFVGWIACALGFVLRGFDSSGCFSRKPGLSWGAGVVLGFLLWVVGLMRA